VSENPGSAQRNNVRPARQSPQQAGAAAVFTSKILITACAISGPMPSPGKMVARNFPAVAAAFEAAAAFVEAARAPCTAFSTKVSPQRGG